jgi:maleamate amidohydrolase
LEQKKHIWEDVMTDEIRQIASNYAKSMGLKKRPALLCIDNYNAVFGDKRETLAASTERFPSSCGERAWDAIEPTQHLMTKAREKNIPVIHTTRDNRLSVVSGIHSTKRKRKGTDMEWNYNFFPPLAPREDELVIHKARASAFYGTPLDSCLVGIGIDTIILCGNSTSGCVRATCLDAYMRGYSVAVVEECVFDRNLLSHKVNLFDMNSKYSDVMFLDDVLAYLETI